MFVKRRVSLALLSENALAETRVDVGWACLGRKGEAD